MSGPLPSSTLPSSTTARWHCLGCGLATEPIRGVHAAREAALLAAVHDQVHHRGALSARVVITDDVPAEAPGAALVAWSQAG